MRWVLVMMRLWAACRNTLVIRTTGTAIRGDDVRQHLASLTQGN
jgi:hypothetical protein